MPAAGAFAATVVAATPWEIVLAVVAGLALAALWVIALFLIVLDDIPGGAKALWLLACILLAPFAVPVYLILRSRRRA